MRHYARRLRASADSNAKVVRSPEEREEALKQAKTHEAEASKLLRGAETRVLDQAQVHTQSQYAPSVFGDGGAGGNDWNEKAKSTAMFLHDQACMLC